MDQKPAHFKDKDAISHVAERQVQGMVDSAEIHGAEMPGHLSAATDAAKETAIFLVITWAILIHLQLPSTKIVLFLSILSAAWLIWKIGRSTWLGWSRLERLHRVLSQEKWEIEHHRPQEREELKELYHAKGFDGKLLDEVVDTLMADGDRLLKVMVEEELGLSVESQEHPIKQGIGAAVGTLVGCAIAVAGLLLFPAWGIVAASLLVIASASGISSHYESNRMVPAIVWNVGIAMFAFGTEYYLLELFI